MKVIDKIKIIIDDIDKLVDVLDEYVDFDDAPWMKWYDENYCNNCIAEIEYSPVANKKLEYAYCELHDKCRYFKDMKEIPSVKEMIRMWLESEVE